MDARIRIACRHVAKARIQKHPPRWLLHIDGMAAVAGGRHGAESQDNGSLPEAGGGRQGAESQDSGSLPEADGRRRGAESQDTGSLPEADGRRPGAESGSRGEEPEASLQYKQSVLIQVSEVFEGIAQISNALVQMSQSSF